MTEIGDALTLTEAQRALLLDYRDNSLTVEEVIERHDSTLSALYRAIRKAREPFRRPKAALKSRVARHTIGPSRSHLLGTAAAPARISDEPVTERLERLLLATIADLEDRTASGRAADPERLARALASHVRTLAALRGLGEASVPARRDARKASPDAGQESDEPDRPARSLAELRDELGRQLERIRLEERARRGLDPDGAEPG